MNKVRVLSLLALVVCIFVFNFGFERFRFDSIKSVNISFQWGLLALAGSYGIISAVAITLLSFFAIQPSPEGSFIIKRNSFYGKLFLSFIGTRRRTSLSLCEAFWETNLRLFGASYIVGLLAIIALVFIKASIIEALFYLGALFCIIAVWACFSAIAKRAERRFLEFKRTQQGVNILVILVDVCFYCVPVALISYLLYLVGIATIWAWAPLLMKWASAFVIGATAIYLIYWIISRQFGEEFSSFYHQNLCPRIKVQ